MTHPIDRAIADRKTALRFLKTWAADLQAHQPPAKLRQMRGLTSSLAVVIMTLEQQETA